MFYNYKYVYTIRGIKVVAMPFKKGPSDSRQDLVVRVDELLVILDKAEELLGIVDGSHRLLQNELVVLDGPSHLFVYEHGLQPLGPLSQATGLVVPETCFAGRQTALHDGLMASRVAVVATDVADDTGIHIEDSVGGADYRSACGRSADHFSCQVLTDHLLQGFAACDGQIAPADVLPANLLAHRFEAEDLGAPAFAFEWVGILAICPWIPEKLPLHPLQALLLRRQSLWEQATVHLVPHFAGCTQRHCTCSPPVHLVTHAVHQIQLADAFVEEAPLRGALEVGRVIEHVVISLVHHAVAVVLVSGEDAWFLVHDQLLVLVVNGRVKDEDLILQGLLLVGSAEHHQLLGIRGLSHGYRRLECE